MLVFLITRHSQDLFSHPPRIYFLTPKGPPTVNESPRAMITLISAGLTEFTFVGTFLLFFIRLASQEYPGAPISGRTANAQNTTHETTENKNF